MTGINGKSADWIKTFHLAHLSVQGGKLFERCPFASQERGFNPGHIHLGFRRQMLGDYVVVVCLVAVEKFLDVAFAGVVGGQGEPPVLETVDADISDTGRRRWRSAPV